MPTKFQQRHYEAIARVIANEHKYYKDHPSDLTDPLAAAASQLAYLFAADNPHFKRALFMAACGLPD